MNIQSNVNQLLSIASLLGSQSPYIKTRKEGLDIQAKQEQAIRGLEDIESNTKRAFITKRLSEDGHNPELGYQFTDEALEEFVGPKSEYEKMAIEEFKKKGPKNYTEEEFKNIGERTRQYQRDIYDAKSAYLNPKYQRFINPEQIRQTELTERLNRIYGYIGEESPASSSSMIEPASSKIEKARAKANDALVAKNAELAASKSFLNTREDRNGK